MRLGALVHKDQSPNGRSAAPTTLNLNLSLKQEASWGVRLCRFPGVLQGAGLKEGDWWNTPAELQTSVKPPCLSRFFGMSFTFKVEQKKRSYEKQTDDEVLRWDSMSVSRKQPSLERQTTSFQEFLPWRCQLPVNLGGNEATVMRCIGPHLKLLISKCMLDVVENILSSSFVFCCFC